MGKFSINGVIVDDEANEVTKRNETVRIEPRLVKLVRLLARNAGNTVSNSDIQKHIWPDVVATSDSISQAVSQIRKILDDNIGDTKVIQTIPKSGYRLVAQVHCTDNDNRLESFAAKPKRFHNPKYVALTLAGLALLIGGLIVYGSGMRWGVSVGIALGTSICVFVVSYITVVRFSDSPKNSPDRSSKRSL